MFALTTGNQREQVEIVVRTGVLCWCGERLDDGMAVAGLQRHDSGQSRVLGKNEDRSAVGNILMSPLLGHDDRANFLPHQ